MPNNAIKEAPEVLHYDHIVMQPDYSYSPAGNKQACAQVFRVLYHREDIYQSLLQENMKLNSYIRKLEKEKAGLLNVIGNTSVGDI